MDWALGLPSSPGPLDDDDGNDDADQSGCEDSADDDFIQLLGRDNVEVDENINTNSEEPWISDQPQKLLGTICDSVLLSSVVRSGNRD